MQIDASSRQPDTFPSSISYRPAYVLLQFPMKLSALAAHLGATLHGDPDAEVTSAAGLEDAGPGQLTFVANPKYTPLARTTQATAVLVEPTFGQIAAATLRIANPYLAFAHALELLYEAPAYAPGIHPTAVIAPTAQDRPRRPHRPLRRHRRSRRHRRPRHPARLTPSSIPTPRSAATSSPTPTPSSASAAVSATTSPCRTAPSSVPTASASPTTTPPPPTRPHPAVIPPQPAVILSEGVADAESKDPRISSLPLPDVPAWHKILQTGVTVLDDHVEIQANSTVDRASIGETHIHTGAKIDNLVMVGHGSSVGANTLLCSQVGLSGSTHVGKNVILAGQVGVAGHLTIGDGAIATAQTGIPSDVAPGATVSGYPAIDNRNWLRSVALFHRLPEIIRELRQKTRE